MSVLISNDNKEVMLLCDCGCDSGIKVRITPEFCTPEYDNAYAFISFMENSYYSRNRSVLQEVKEHTSNAIKNITGGKVSHQSIIMNRSTFMQIKDALSYLGAVNPVEKHCSYRRDVSFSRDPKMRSKECLLSPNSGETARLVISDICFDGNDDFPADDTDPVYEISYYTNIRDIGIFRRISNIIFNDYHRYGYIEFSKAEYDAFTQWFSYRYEIMTYKHELKMKNKTV